jgi:hypothetical protein
MLESLNFCPFPFSEIYGSLKEFRGEEKGGKKGLLRFGEVCSMVRMQEISFLRQKQALNVK